MSTKALDKWLYGILIVIDLLLFIRIVYVFVGTHSWIFLSPLILGVTYILLLPIYAVFPSLSQPIGFDTGAFAGILLYTFLLNTVVLLSNLRGKEPTIENMEEASGVGDVVGAARKLQHEVGDIEEKIPGVEIHPEPSSQQVQQSQHKQPSQQQEVSQQIQSPSNAPMPDSGRQQDISQSKRKRRRRKKKGIQQNRPSEQEVHSSELWPENTPVKLEDE